MNKVNHKVNNEVNHGVHEYLKHINLLCDNINEVIKIYFENEKKDLLNKFENIPETKKYMEKINTQLYDCIYDFGKKINQYSDEIKTNIDYIKRKIN